MLVLSATASPTERRFSMGVVDQLFSCLETAGSLPGPPAKINFHQRTPKDPEYAQFTDLFTTLSRVAQHKPILLTVDCVQCVDSDSLSWLGFLMRRIDNIPVVLLASQRRGEPASDQHLLVEFMNSVRPDRHLRLHDLSPSAASHLIDSLRGCSRDTSDDLIADSGGNPYLLTQQVLTTPAPAPSCALTDDDRPADPSDDLTIRLRAVKDRVLCLLRRLDGNGLRVAHAASVVGETAVNAELVAELCSLTVAEAGQSLGQLTECGILHPTTRTFRHPVLARLLYLDVPIAQRAAFHRRTALHLHQDGAAPGSITTHLLRASPLEQPWMAPMLLDAAEGLLPRGAHAAMEHLDTVVRHGAPDDVASRIADLRVRALMELDLPASADAQYSLVNLTADPLELADRSARLADTLLRLDQPDQARSVLDRAHERVRGHDAGTAARLRRQLGHVRLYEGSHTGGPAGLERLEAVLLHRTSTGQTAPAVRRICRVFLAPPRALYGSPSWYHALLALLWAGGFDQAQQYIDAEVRLAVAEGTVTRVAEAHAVRSLVLLHRGALADAGDEARQALTALGRISADRHHTGALARSVLIDVAVERDQLTEAGDLLDVELPTGQATGRETEQSVGQTSGQATGWWHLHLAHSTARALGRLGQVERALTLVTHCERELDRRRIDNPAILPWRSTKALLHAGLGNLPEARRLARQEVDRARRWAAPFAWGRALLALASVSASGNVLGPARGAMELLDSEEAPLLFAHALYAAGEAHQRGGTTARARELLHRANEVGISLGADALVDQVQRTLRDAGGRPGPRKTSTRSLLTPTECQVAELAAGGMSNRDIARMLRVSLRNVESHLTHCYRKLRIGGRRELSRFFQAEDPEEKAPGRAVPHGLVLDPRQPQSV